MWTGYLEIGGIEVASGERVRANIATGPCPSGALKPMKCNTIAEARELMGELPPSFDRIEEAPWYDPAIPASGRLLGFELLEGKGLGDTRRSVTALEGLGDGQTFTASRKQGREARFTVMVVALDQGALEYGRAWLSSILDGTRCGDEGGECGLFDVTWYAECPPSPEDFMVSNEESLESPDGVNLVYNPTFDNPMNYLRGWARTPSGSIGSTIVPGVGRVIRAALDIQASQVGLLGDTAQGGLFGRVEAGDMLTASVWLNHNLPEGSSFVVNAVYFNEAGNYFGVQEGLFIGTVPDAESRFHFEFPDPAPGGVARVALAVSGVGPAVDSLPAGTFIEIGQPRIAIGHGPDARVYFDGDTQDTAEHLYVWDNGPGTTTTRYPARLFNEPAYLAELPRGRRSMLDCSTISGPIEGELRDADSLWLQELEFTVASELAGTYTDPSSADVSSSVGPSPIVEFFRNLIENPRGIAASGNVEVGRNLVTNPSLETNTSGWSGTNLQRVAKPSQLAGQGSWCAYGRGTSAGPDVTPRANLRTPSVSVSAGTSYPVRLGIGFGKSGPNPTTFSCSAVVEWSNGAKTTLYTANSLTGTRRWASVDTRVTAPSGATSMRIFIETSAGWGDTAQVWADAVVVLSGDLTNVNLYPASEVSAMPLIGATSPVNDLTFAWAGTANASQTIIRYSNPARWVSNGTTTKVARINSSGRDACLVRSPGGSGVFAGGYMSLNPVVPGVEYFPSIDARGWKGSMAVDGAAVRWYTSTGTFLSETVFAAGQTVIATAWTVFAGSVVAPATAARAAVVVKFPTAARRVQLSNVMLAPTQPSPFFDGDSLDTPTREYAWEGTRHASASTSTPVESTVVVDPLADPSCPPVPTPPRPPVVDESCGADVQSWSRFFYSIGSSGIPGALDLIPTFTITADRVLDAARISLLPNPEGVDPDALATDPVASWVLSYLPANTPLTIDSLHREVTANISGQTLPADHLLTGASGQPLVWPVLTCSQGYVLVIETPFQGSGGQIQPEVSVEGRVMYR